MPLTQQLKKLPYIESAYYLGIVLLCVFMLLHSMILGFSFLQDDYLFYLVFLVEISLVCLVLILFVIHVIRIFLNRIWHKLLPVGGWLFLAPIVFMLVEPLPMLFISLETRMVGYEEIRKQADLLMESADKPGEELNYKNMPAIFKKMGVYRGYYDGNHVNLERKIPRKSVFFITNSNVDFHRNYGDINMKSTRLADRIYYVTYKHL